MNAGGAAASNASASTSTSTSTSTMVLTPKQRAWFKQIGYVPHREQIRYHTSQARFRTACCGRRFGKSTMAGRDYELRLYEPKKRFWIVGPTYDLGEKEFRVIWNDIIVGQKLGLDKRVKKAYNRRSGTMMIEFPWGTLLEVRSADHPENLVGEALDGLILSEAAKQREETWTRFLQPALADRRGIADFPTTPEGFNWLHKMWQLGQNPDPAFKDFDSWRFPSWSNNVIFPGGRNDPEILLLEKTLPPEAFLQEIGADFASFVGKIFPEWDETKHVRAHTFRPDWPNYIAFDWGYANPMAAIEFQISPQDTIHVWREHYRALTRLEDNIRMMIQRPNPPGYRLDMGFGDAADPEAVATVSQFLVPTIAYPEAKENWRDGIECVRGFMRDRYFDPATADTEIDEFGTPADPEPGFFVTHDCPNLIHEINNYKTREPVKGRNVPEMSNKIEDHAIDALRYGLVHIYRLGATSHLSDVYGAGGYSTLAGSHAYAPASAGGAGSANPHRDMESIRGLITSDSEGIAADEAFSFGAIAGREF